MAESVDKQIHWEQSFITSEWKAWRLSLLGRPHECQTRVLTIWEIPGQQWRTN